VVAPVAVEPIGYNTLKIQIKGRDQYGRELGIPSELTSTISLKNPNQLSREVSELMAKLVGRTGPAVTDVQTAHGWGELLTDLEDALEAVRYHQRQYLTRYRIVQAHYSQLAVTGSQQLQVVFDDRPLQCEFEAVVIRARAVLDASGHLALYLWGQKPDKFGAFCKFVQKQGRKLHNPEQILALISENERWLLPDRDYRDMIVHRGQLRPFRGVKVGVQGVDVARVEKDDTVEYCLKLWPKIIDFTGRLMELVIEAR
jgi:hypothetical protein